MNDPSLPLQAAIFARLNGSAELAAAMGGQVRFYDRAPERPPYPYGLIGLDETLDDGDTCHDGAVSFPTVDVFSKAVGKVEAKRIAAIVADLLDAEIEIEGHQVVTHKIERIRHLATGDGLTSHSQVVARYQTAPTA